MIVIDIPEEIIKDAKESPNYYPSYLFGTIWKSIGNGTPISGNATNGYVIKAMFDIKEVDMSNTYCVHFPKEEDYSHYFFKDWWNAPYQKGGKEEYFGGELYEGEFESR